MRQAIVSVDNDAVEEFGMEDFFSVLREAGQVDTEILSCEGSQGVARVRVKDKPDENRLDELDSVEWWEEATSSGPERVYLIGYNIPDSVDERVTCRPNDTLPVEYLEIDEEGYTFDVTGSQQAISEFVSQHKDAGVDITLEKLRDYRGSDSSLDSLTQRQREILRTAYDLGYYEVPRSTSTNEVAEEVGLDDSTVSEHLQRAEQNLLSSVLEV